MDLEEANPKYIPVTVTPPAEGVAQGVLNAARSRWWFVEDRLVEDRLIAARRPRRRASPRAREAGAVRR